MSLRRAAVLPLALASLVLGACRGEETKPDPVVGDPGAAGKGAADGGGQSGSGGAVDGPGLRVATFNVARFFNTTCDTGTCGGDAFEPVVDKAAFDKKVASLVQGFQTLDADVLLLEEIEEQSCLDAVVQKLGGQYPTAVVAETGFAASVDVAVLSRLPLIETRTHRQDQLPLEGGGTTTFTREFFEVRLSRGGVPITVFAAHFRSKRDDDADRRRAEGIGARKIVLAAHAERPDELMVWGGDLNDHPGSPDFDLIFAGGDLVRVVAEDLPYPQDATFQFGGTRSAIDHLIVPKAQAGRHLKGSSKVFRGSGTWGFASSDHAAVRATFE